MNFVTLIFAGGFLCNCVPHLAGGLQGAPFPTPFAKPSGIGDSSPLVNFLWGASNGIAGWSLLAIHPVSIGFSLEFGAFLLGALLIGLHLSIHFAKVRKARLAGTASTDHC